MALVAHGTLTEPLGDHCWDLRRMRLAVEKCLPISGFTLNDSPLQLSKDHLGITIIVILIVNIGHKSIV
jgi:hypothetical protein